MLKGDVNSVPFHGIFPKNETVFANTASLYFLSGYSTHFFCKRGTI